MQFGNCHRSLKSEAIALQLFSVTGPNESGPIIFQILLQVCLIILETVDAPNKCWYDIEIILSPEARYLKQKR